MTWTADQFPPMRAEAHFGDRIVSCFAERPTNFHALLFDSAQKDPGAEALAEVAESGSRRLTWVEALEEVDQLASALVSRGAQRGDRIAMLLGNGVRFPLFLFAVARMGGIAVPISIRSSAAEVAHIIDDSGARLIVHDADLAEGVPGEGERPDCEAIDLEALGGTAPLPELASLPGEEDTAMILYTSGTTGRPKGAELTHLGLVHAGIYYASAMSLGPRDRVLATVPLNHVTGIAALIAGPIRGGASLIIMEEFKARRFLDIAETEAMTYTLMVPAMYNLCLREPEFASRDLSSWRLGAYGGAPMPEATIRRLSEAVPGLQFANCYGSTESVIAQLVTPPELGYERRDYVGCELPGTRTRVMDTEGRECAPGEPGELWLSGPNVVKGYWNNAQATSENFFAGYWRSGDIGIKDADGFVRVMDRAKDMINRGGHKIYSAELESVLTAHDAVSEAAAIARPCPVLGERVHAVVVLRSDVTQEELRSWAAGRLSDYKVPESFTLQREPLLRNPNGKVDKKVLRERDRAELESSA